MESTLKLFFGLVPASVWDALEISKDQEPFIVLTLDKPKFGGNPQFVGKNKCRTVDLRHERLWALVETESAIAILPIGLSCGNGELSFAWPCIAEDSEVRVTNFTLSL